MALNATHDQVQFLVKTLMLGPYVGTMFTVVFYGILCSQVVLYFENYPSDSPFTRGAVGVLWVLESAQTVLCIIFLQQYLLGGFGDVEGLTMVQYSIVPTVILGYLCAWIVNMLFINKIRLLSKHMWSSILLAILATIRLGLGLAVIGIGFPQRTWAGFQHYTKPFIIASPSIAFVVDGLIASLISWHLLRGREHLGERTQSILNALLKYAVSTGAITTIINALELVSMLALPNTLAYLAFVMVQSKLYANCYLAMLNARRSIREKHIGPRGEVLYSKPDFRGIDMRTTRLDGVAITSERFIAVDMPLTIGDDSRVTDDVESKASSDPVTLVIV